MRKSFDLNSLDRIAIVGVGVLGGSIGLALRAAGFAGVRVGVGRRRSSLRKALACEAVDEVTRDPAAGVRDAQLVILCTPIGKFEPLLMSMVDSLSPGSYVTDVASTKAEVVRMAGRILPKGVRFVGSHPMAGSEKTGVEVSRADLFERALCLVTPTPKTPATTVRYIRRFWETLGGRTMELAPAVHDKLLARASHVPHAVASALVKLATHGSAIELAGPGFGDTTRIASGDPAMWTDIIRTNRQGMLKAIDQLTRELNRLSRHVERDDAAAIYRWLDESKKTRDQWVARRYKKKVLPP